MALESVWADRITAAGVARIEHIVAARSGDLKYSLQVAVPDFEGIWYNAAYGTSHEFYAFSDGADERTPPGSAPRHRRRKAVRVHQWKTNTPTGQARASSS
jgi:hypothetical protein